jgi:Mn2+/Fe2+ NRAMP family transporter
MGFSNVIAFFIIVTVAATLNAHGITRIETSRQVAEALRPIAGRYAELAFAVGVIATGLLAVPVLAGATGYAIGEALQWPVGLGRHPRDAKAFYATILVATLLGVALNFSSVDPIKALFWSAVLNGVSAFPIMVLIMRLGSRTDVMGKFPLPRRLRLVGWAATAVMGLVLAGLVWTTLAGS